MEIVQRTQERDRARATSGGAADHEQRLKKWAALLGDRAETSTTTTGSGML